MHIVQRGVDRNDCFRTDADFLTYLRLLNEAARSAACAVHAYCLMTNHVHLLVTPDVDDGCSVLMKALVVELRRESWFTRG